MMGTMITPQGLPIGLDTPLKEQPRDHAIKPIQAGLASSPGWIDGWGMDMGGFPTWRMPKSP